LRRLAWGIQRRHIVITETTIAKVITETTEAITETTITKAEPERSAANRTPSEVNDSTEATGSGERPWKGDGGNFREKVKVTNALAPGKNGTNGKPFGPAEFA
jgi:hypothetical protein